MSVLARVLLVAFVVFSCMCLGVQDSAKPSNVSSNAYYRVVSTEPYNKSSCGGTGFHYQEDGFNTGLRVLMSDEKSGMPLQGRISLVFPDGSGGNLGGVNFSACEEGVNFTSLVVFASAEGHSPVALLMEPPENQISTLEVFMPESCGGGPGFFDNALVLAKLRSEGNASMQELLFDGQRDIVSDLILEYFNLSASDYELSCVEGDFGRGGFVRARGVYRSLTPFDLYYHWGWCSPGGGDCGWRACFSSSNSLLQDVKRVLCPRLSSYTMREDYSQPGVVSMVVVEDRTNETVRRCLEGGFDQELDGLVSLSLVQASSRYGSEAAVSEGDCISL